LTLCLTGYIFVKDDCYSRVVAGARNDPENKLSRNLGQALRAERKTKGMSQKAVGHSVGMEQHTISKIEKETLEQN